MEITAETMRAHRATWYVWAGGYGEPLVKLRRTAQMRGQWAGYDVECSCGGWASNTGGAVRKYIEDELWFHRWSAQNDAQAVAETK